MLLVEVKLHHLLPLFSLHILFLDWYQKVWPRFEVHSHSSKDWALVGSVYFKWFYQEKSIGRAWWHTPLITEFRRLRQMDHWVRGQPGQQTERVSVQSKIHGESLSWKNKKEKENIPCKAATRKCGQDSDRFSHLKRSGFRWVCLLQMIQSRKIPQNKSHIFLGFS